MRTIPTYKPDTFCVRPADIKIALYFPRLFVGLSACPNLCTNIYLYYATVYDRAKSTGSDDSRSYR